MKYSQLYALLGFLMGWGAPSGALVLRFFVVSPISTLYEFLGREWMSNSLFYWYMLVGTCLVFTVIGFVLGRHQDREIERNRERVGA